MARGRNNKLRKGERAAAKMGMPFPNPLDPLPASTSSTRSRLADKIEEKKLQQSASKHGDAHTDQTAGERDYYYDQDGHQRDAANGPDYAQDEHGDNDGYHDDHGSSQQHHHHHHIQDDDGDAGWSDEDESSSNHHHSSSSRGHYPTSGLRSSSHYDWARGGAVSKSHSSSKSLAPSTKSKRTGAASDSSPLPDPLDDEELCDHKNLIPHRMRTVTSLLNDIFSASFKMAVPALYRGMIHNIQDEIMRDKLMTFIDNGLSPKAIRTSASNSVTRQSIKSQLKLACEEELADVVLRLSTEDAFDLLCDLALRHGRNLRTWGPPCACSFSHCLPCLERLVNTVKTTPAPKDHSLYSHPSMDSTSRLAIAAAAAAATKANETTTDSAPKSKGKKTGKGNPTPPAAAATNSKSKPSAVAAPTKTPPSPNPRSRLSHADLMMWVETLIEAEWVDKKGDWSEPKKWEPDIWAAWNAMNDVVWEVANESDPLVSLPRVSEYLAGLRQINGLDLYYAVVTREMTFNPSLTRASKEKSRKERAESQATGGVLVSPARAVADGISWEGVYERMKKDIHEIKRIQRAEERGKGRADAHQTQQQQLSAATTTTTTTTTAACIDGDEEDDVEGADYRRALARAIREQGNKSYASHAYTEAVDHYTRAMGFDRTEPIYPLNRAACLLKLRRFGDAERDCSAAIRLDPVNHKAYFRRGASWAGMGKVSLARQDFDKVLQLQRDIDPQALDELRKLADKFIADAAPGKDAAKKAATAAASSDGQVESSGGKSKGSTSAAAGKKGTPATSQAPVAAAGAPTTTAPAKASTPIATAGQHPQMSPTALVEKVLDEQRAWLKVELRRQDVEESIATFKKRRQKQEDAAKLDKENVPSKARANNAAATATAGASSSAATSPRTTMRRISVSDADDDYEDRSSVGSGDVAPSSATSDPVPAHQNTGANRKISSGPMKSGTANSDEPGVEGTEPASKATLAETRNGPAEMEDAFGKDAMAAYHSRNNLAPLSYPDYASLAPHDLAETTPASDEGIQALINNPSETVACWTTFAFVFSLIVAQKTGINVPERLGFVRQYGCRGSGRRKEQRLKSGKAEDADSDLDDEEEEEEDAEDSLVAELRRAAEKRGKAVPPLPPSGNKANAAATTATTTSWNDTLELLRSVPLEEHLDRIVNFLRQPEVQPVMMTA
ncbi:RNA polymerase II-associated protein 3 [Tilletia horrida]|nr:RNA polymerase II-associated protein 3 [Tilletia horrida]KAK0563119.1 RNA polymerase II-associated protein 3 [Tilletia horrida]